VDKQVDFDKLREEDNQARDEHGVRLWVVTVNGPGSGSGEVRPVAAGQGEDRRTASAGAAQPRERRGTSPTGPICAPCSGGAAGCPPWSGTCPPLLIDQHATSERDREIAAGMDRRIAKQTSKKRPRTKRPKEDR